MPKMRVYGDTLRVHHYYQPSPDNKRLLFGGRLAFAGPPDELAAQATGRVFESPVPIDHPSTRALGPDRFRVVDVTPPEGRPVEPTVHDGYLAVLRDVSVTAG